MTSRTSNLQLSSPKGLSGWPARLEGEAGQVWTTSVWQRQPDRPDRRLARQADQPRGPKGVPSVLALSNYDKSFIYIL